MTLNTVIKDSKAQKHFKGRNFMTADIHQTGYIKTPTKKLAYEISWGTGIFSKWIIGVTISSHNIDEKLARVMSTCFSSDSPGDYTNIDFSEAYDYLSTLDPDNVVIED